MDPKAREELLDFYNSRLERFGDRPEALSWSPQGQLRRFHTLAEIAPDLNGASVLDYGCGTGDFYGFLKGRGFDVRYTGVDVNERFIELARRKHPECAFQVMDAPDDRLEGRFDYAVICGVFNLNVPGVAKDMEEALVTLFRRCDKGMAVNCISTHATDMDPRWHYTSPDEIVRFTLERLSPYFALRHDRIPEDFTLYVYAGLNPVEP